MDEKIIKARTPADALPSSARVVKAEVYEASREAEQILIRARREAEVILAEAGGQAEAAREAARQQGYQEGLSHWNQALADALAARENLLLDGQQEVVRLAVRVAEKIIGEQIRADPGTVVSIVREALKSVGRERSLTIQVNPQHVEEVRSRMERLQEALGTGRQIQVQPSPAVSIGGCVVESELGVIDARLETQLQCLEEVMLRAAKRS